MPHDLLGTNTLQLNGEYEASTQKRQGTDWRQHVHVCRGSLHKMWNHWAGPRRGWETHWVRTCNDVLVLNWINITDPAVADTLCHSERLGLVWLEACVKERLVSQTVPITDDKLYILDKGCHTYHKENVAKRHINKPLSNCVPNPMLQRHNFSHISHSTATKNRQYWQLLQY